MTSLVAIVFFAGFVLTALAAGLTRRRGAVNVFIAWTLAASFAAGLAQRDAWPFASWPLVAGIHPPEATHPRLVGVDGGGAEHAIDFRSWEPLGIDELYAWLRGPFADLTLEEKDAAFAWLLAKAEAGRLRALDGVDPSGGSGLLGPLEAPRFLLHPEIWNDAIDAPGAPSVSLRLYLETWSIEERARGEGATRRTLVHEGPHGSRSPAPPPESNPGEKCDDRPDSEVPEDPDGSSLRQAPPGGSEAGSGGNLLGAIGLTGYGAFSLHRWLPAGSAA